MAVVCPSTPRRCVNTAACIAAAARLASNGWPTNAASQPERRANPKPASGPRRSAVCDDELDTWSYSPEIDGWSRRLPSISSELTRLGKSSVIGWQQQIAGRYIVPERAGLDPDRHDVDRTLMTLSPHHPDDQLTVSHAPRSAALWLQDRPLARFSTRRAPPGVRTPCPRRSSEP